LETSNKSGENENQPNASRKDRERIMPWGENLLFIFLINSWNRIIAMIAPRMTGENSLDGKKTASNKSVLFQSQYRVFRASGCIAAGIGKPWRNKNLIDPDD
jgi:hypothetical protein